ncbi:hypothetical protein QAD02_001432 [Eretmocerus hayati]|uniref:Uncharacterized protein n=1 Tax=Eretmocerus hayati TaxID=131215 RepID=A0ACC2NH93_9HYME|nr:hypothetical protein QAD02_001432 [Eretmocerus hayati]
MITEPVYREMVLSGVGGGGSGSDVRRSRIIAAAVVFLIFSTALVTLSLGTSWGSHDAEIGTLTNDSMSIEYVFGRDRAKISRNGRDFVRRRIVDNNNNDWPVLDQTAMNTFDFVPKGPLKYYKIIVSPADASKRITIMSDDPVQWDLLQVVHSRISLITRRFSRLFGLNYDRIFSENVTIGVYSDSTLYEMYEYSIKDKKTIGMYLPTKRYIAMECQSSGNCDHVGHEFAHHLMFENDMHVTTLYGKERDMWNEGIPTMLDGGWIRGWVGNERYSKYRRNATTLLEAAFNYPYGTGGWAHARMSCAVPSMYTRFRDLSRRSKKKIHRFVET